MRKRGPEKKSPSIVVDEVPESIMRLAEKRAVPLLKMLSSHRVQYNLAEIVKAAYIQGVNDAMDWQDGFRE